MTPRSRYPLTLDAAVPGRDVRTRARAGADGTVLLYLGRRLLPLPETVTRQTSYVVRAGDRIDRVAAQLLGDPTLYWLLMEANGASDPAALCAVPGRRLAVPAPVGQMQDPLDRPRASARTTLATPVTHADDAEEAP